MEFFVTFFDYLSVRYIISVILITYFVISLWFTNSKESIKKLITVIVGILFALFWYFCVDALALQDIIPSFAVAIVLYDYIIKFFLKLLKITYKNLSEKEEKTD